MAKEVKFKKPSLFIMYLILVTMVCLSPGKAETNEKEDEDHLIKVICRNKPNGLSPGTVTVKPGETVVWYNNDLSPVRIKFLTKGMLATKAPVNFYGGFAGRYESTMVPHGGTASLCFMREGKYSYEVLGSLFDEEGNKSELILEGTIIVEN